MFVSKLVTKILNVNPKVSIKYITLSTLHKNHTSMVLVSQSCLEMRSSYFYPSSQGIILP